jgi:hypothetical protein
MRGQKQAADTQIANTTGKGNQFLSNATGELSNLTDQASTLMNGGLDLSSLKGYDPATMGAITGTTMGAAVSPFNSAQGQIKRNAAIRGNSAGIGEDLTALAGAKSRATSPAAQSTELANTDFKTNNFMKGLDLQNSLFGTNTGAGVSLLGQVPGLLGGRAAGGGWSQGFKDVLGSLSGSGYSGGGKTYAA